MLLHDKLKSYTLILASQSPRRRELLTGSGLEYQLAAKYQVEELFPSDMPLYQVAEYLSQLKSEGYPERLGEGDILLTADTVVIVGSEILGKPHSHEEACQMLRKLSGATHTVVTGVTLRTATRRHSFSAESAVRFRTLTDEEICYYVDNFRPFDKAGSYGIQEWIGYVAIEGIEGSFYNVMGLPIQRLYVELDEFINKTR